MSVLPPRHDPDRQTALEWDIEVAARGIDPIERAQLAGAAATVGIAFVGILLGGLLRSLRFDRRLAGSDFVWIGVAAIPLMALVGLGTYWQSRRTRPIPGGSWTVRFTLHGLGAEASCVTSAELAVQLRARLSCRSWQRGPIRAFWFGLAGEWAAKDAQHQGMPAGLAHVGIDWTEVTRVALDQRQRWIDLGAEDSPGLRLFCPPEQFDDIRRFIQRQLPMQLWSALTPRVYERSGR
jgi:hypothetical protein